MKKIKLVIILWAAIMFFYQLPVCPAAQYREIATSLGKVVTGLDREQAYQRFGAPVSKSNDLWYYTGSDPAGFFVKFSKTTPSILLYPGSYLATRDVPLEFKAFLSLPDSTITEITKEVQLVFDQPACAKVTGTGVIMPKQVGEYSALAIYQDLLSNPLHLQVKEAKESDLQEKNRLLSIDLLPYQPTINPGGVINFVALGTFFDNELNEYSVKDITQEAGWAIRQRPNTAWNEEANYRLYFLKPGQAEVLAKSAAMESFLQRVEVKELLNSGGKILKHLLVLPEAMKVNPDSNINLRVFGSYLDNSVMELTQEVKWKISDSAVLKPSTSGYFIAKAEGVTEVTASKDGVESLPVKVVVVKQKASLLAASLMENYAKENSPPPPRNMLNQIKDDVEKLKKDFSVKKKELRNIQITPKLLELGLGEKGKLSAVGFYNDGSSSDLTILGNWFILDQGIATVASGNIACVSVGQTSAYVEFKGVRSEYASVVVGGPRLVSLLLTPQSLKLPRDAKATFKVQGNYYDHSVRELTEQVSWRIDGPAVARIDKGVLLALKFGHTKIHAEYLSLKSNTASIDVVFTLGWLLWLLAKIILILLLGIFCLAMTLYLLSEIKRRRLRLLRKNPREFILGLHGNAIRLITIFGLRYDAYTFPLFYAESAKKKFLVDNNVFLNFSVKFEEAKYSQHVLEDSHALAALSDYNIFFERLCKNQTRLLSSYRHGLALLHCQPIFIFSTLEAGGAK
ncbi:MAG: hypothetical protein V1830_03070 [Candidatus Omnitrophota bacterium]